MVVIEVEYMDGSRIQWKASRVPCIGECVSNAQGEFCEVKRVYHCLGGVLDGGSIVEPVQALVCVGRCHKKCAYDMCGTS